MKTVRTLTLATTIALVAVVLGAVAGGALSGDTGVARARLYSFGSTLIAMTILGKRFPF